MALKWTEGFELYQGAVWLTDNYGSLSLPGVSFGDGRLLSGWQGKCLVHQNVTSGYLRTFSFGTTEEWFIGLWLDATYSASTVDLIEYRSAAGVNLFRIRVARRSATQFRFEFLEQSTLRANSIDLDYVSSTGYYVTASLTLNPPGGLAQCDLYYRVGGTLSLGFVDQLIPSLDTLPAMIGIGFGSGSATETFKIDDIYICDGNGTNNNSRNTSEFAIEGLLPNGNGATTEWDGVQSGNPAANHGGLLDDPASAADHDADESYIVTEEDNEIDLLAYAPLAYITGGIKGIRVNTIARLETAESKDLEIRYRNVVGLGTALATHAISSTSYTSWNDIVEEEPFSIAGWTVSKINNAQFGVKSLT